jgi:hypothetical protein
LRLAPLGASVEMTVEANAGSPAAEWIDMASPDQIGVTLGHAFVACGAIAGFVCSLAANLLGLTMQPEFARPEAAAPPDEGA